MFLNARFLLQNHDFVIAVNESGEHVAVMRQEPCAYVHAYSYAGGVDMWLLNRYECLFLHGCNEYSVELCISALHLWKGRRLVLVGKDWEYLLPALPDLNHIECLWEDELTQEDLAELTGDASFLHIVPGMAYEESPERYEKGVLLYDEVMTLTFFFSDKKENGAGFPDKSFFVIDASYGNLGLFSLYDKAVSAAVYAKKCGFIPVFHIENKYGKESIYQNHPKDELWTKFYSQPEGYTIDDIKNAKNVTYSPFFYNARILQTIMDYRSAGTELLWTQGRYNARVSEYVATRAKKFLPYPEQTLGVLIRGTDYAVSRFANHSIHATKEMVAEKIDRFLDEWGLKYIYLATEDAGYCEWFSRRYEGKIFFTDQERYQTRPGEMLSQMHRNNKGKRDGFLHGAEYILSIQLLSECRSLLASGSCAGYWQAKKLRQKPYAQEYVFDLGKHATD